MLGRVAAGRSERSAELPAVEIEVLRGVVVNLSQCHGGFEERVPPGGVAHRPRQAGGIFPA